MHSSVDHGHYYKKFRLVRFFSKAYESKIISLIPKYHVVRPYSYIPRTFDTPKTTKGGGKHDKLWKIFETISNKNLSFYNGKHENV